MASSWKAVVQCKQDARTEAIAKVGKLLEVESVAASEDKHYIQAPGTRLYFLSVHQLRKSLQRLR